MSQDGRVVGKLSVKVSPDTDGFRAELKKQLEAIDRTLKGEVKVSANFDEAGLAGKVHAAAKAADATTTIKTDVDSSSMRKKLDSLSLAFEKRMRSALDIKQLVPDSFAGMQRKLGTLDLGWDQKLKDALASFKPKPLQLKLDDQFDYNLRQRLSKIKPVEVKVEPDVNHFREKMTSEVKAAAAKIDAKIPFTADGERMRRDIAAQVKLLEHTLKADLPVDLHLAAGQRAKIAAEVEGLKNLANLGDGGTKSLDAIGQSASGAGASISRMGLIISAVFALAAPAIALVAGLLAGLPSLMVGAGVGAGAIALGLDGIKKAATDAGLFADSNGSKKGGGGLGAAFTSLKEAVSATFVTQLKGQFDSLAGILPSLSTGFSQVASGLSQISGGFIAAITSAAGMDKINNILTQTGSFFSGLGPIVQTATQGFLTLANSGANAFNLLLAPLQAYATQFDGIIARITSSGAFESAMQGLSSVVNSLLSLFGKLFESGVNAMGQLGGPLSTLIDGFGNALIALMPALTSLSGLLGTVLGTALNQLAPVFTALTPGFTQLASVLGTTLVTALGALGPSLTVIGGALSGALVTAITQITPLLPGMVDSFTRLGVAVAGELKTSLPLIAEAIGKVLGVLAANGDALIKGLADAFIQLVPVLPGAATAFAQMAPSMIRMMDALGPMAPTVQLLLAQMTVLTPILVTLLGPLAGVAGSFDRVKESVLRFGAAVIEHAGQVVVEVTALPGKILGALGNLGTTLLAAGASLMEGLLNGIRQGFEAVKGFVGGIAQWIKDHKGPISYDKTVLIGNGQALMDGLGTGLATGFESVLAQAKEMAAAISKAMTDGTDLTGMLGGAKLPALTKELATIEEQKKAIKVQLDAVPDGKANKPQKDLLRDQIKQLQAQKDQLALQQDQIKNENKYGDSLDANGKKIEDAYGKALGKGLAAPVNFAKATTGQFLSDIGVGSNGLLSKLLTETTQYIFNVGSVDDAMAVKQNEQGRKALQVIGR